MAGAVMAGNVLALGFTVVFARKLGQTGYGSLSALISAYIILMVPGSAVQTTVAREVSAAVASGSETAGAGVRRWIARLAAATVALTALAVLGRHPIASLIGVGDLPWAAAATLPSGCLWLILAIQRGALQGFHRYRMVGASWVAEQVARFAFAFALVGAGGGVTGAFVATPLGLAAVAIALFVPLGRLLPSARAEGHRLRELLVRAAGPVAALALVAWMQDGHVIIVKHIASATRQARTARRRWRRRRSCGSPWGSASTSCPRSHGVRTCASRRAACWPAAWG
jgi:O-antigen/teichoic acid export membrane protein